MKVVKVYGALKERLGQGRFELDVKTPAEAVRALCANFAGLDKWIVDSSQDGVGYKVKIGKELIDEDQVEELHSPWSERDVFSITPVVTGAGSGFGKVLAGIVLIGAAFLTGGATIGTFGLTKAVTVKSVLIKMGTFVALTGVAQMLSPIPKMPDMKEANTVQNFSFSGVTNTAQVGVPVPIAYGRLFVGSVVIAAGLDTDQLEVS